MSTLMTAQLQKKWLVLWAVMKQKEKHLTAQISNPHEDKYFCNSAFRKDDTTVEILGTLCVFFFSYLESIVGKILDFCMLLRSSSQS